ncbi:MAG: hypothetical protein ABI874_00525 [Chloroflexota bacterium]
MNLLYRNDLPVMMNLCQPPVKLLKKLRVGSRLTRQYAVAQTPLDRLLVSPLADVTTAQTLLQQRKRLDPFQLTQKIDMQLEHILSIAHERLSPRKRSVHNVFGRETTTGS